MDNGLHALTILLLHILKAQKAASYRVVEHDGHHAVAFQPYVVNGYLCCLQGVDNRVEAKGVAFQLAVPGSFQQRGMKAFAVVILENSLQFVVQFGPKCLCCLQLFFCKNQFVFHIQELTILIMIQSYKFFSI